MKQEHLDNGLAIACDFAHVHLYCRITVSTVPSRYLHHTFTAVSARTLNIFTFIMLVRIRYATPFLLYYRLCSNIN